MSVFPCRALQGVGIGHCQAFLWGGTLVPCGLKLRAKALADLDNHVIYPRPKGRGNFPEGRDIFLKSVAIFLKRATLFLTGLQNHELSLAVFPCRALQGVGIGHCQVLLWGDFSPVWVRRSFHKKLRAKALADLDNYAIYPRPKGRGNIPEGRGNFPEGRGNFPKGRG